MTVVYGNEVVKKGKAQQSKTEHSLARDQNEACARAGGGEDLAVAWRRTDVAPQDVVAEDAEYTRSDSHPRSRIFWTRVDVPVEKEREIAATVVPAAQTNTCGRPQRQSHNHRRTRANSWPAGWLWLT